MLYICCVANIVFEGKKKKYLVLVVLLGLATSVCLPSSSQTGDIPISSRLTEILGIESHRNARSSVVFFRRSKHERMAKQVP